MLHALILAGGSGKRFWPLSRRRMPKQLLRIASEVTLIEDTVARLHGLVPASRVHILTNASTVATIRKLLHKVPAAQVVGEPEGRDTAAAIGLGAVLAAKDDPEAVVVVLPADHVIRPAAAFRKSLAAAAAAAAKSDALFVFGVKPDHPATGYGYVKRGPRAGASRGVPVFRVAKFVEKPDEKTAKRYVADGGYFWNSGVFCWRASAILGALRKFRPGVAGPLDRIAAAGASTAALKREFHKVEKISIDYAVLENSPDVRMMAADWHWDDVGSWTSVAAYVREDGRGNRARGKHFSLDSDNCLVLTDGHLIGTVGVRDLVIVRTKDATLVCHRDRAQDVKKLVELLEAAGEEHVL